MGQLFYDGDQIVDLADRTLMHVQLALSQKLRRSEGFLFTWNDAIGDPPGYNSIWLSPSIPLRFKFDAPPTLPINREWVDSMVSKAALSGNLVITADPSEPVRGSSVSTSHLADSPL
jgi:hypothetical protein